MPVTPVQAREISKAREKLLNRIDSAIFQAYSEEVPSEVKVEISTEEFKNEALMDWLCKQYEQAGWKIHFDKNLDLLWIVLEDLKK